MTLVERICFGAAILLSFALTAGSQETCTPKQSPRNIQDYPFPGPYNGKPPAREQSLVTNIDGAATIKYQGQVLVRCDQHYHAPVENTQGCRNETVGSSKEPMHDGEWVEVHTVYAPEIEPGCDGLDHNLECCKGTPVVVRGFSAKVENTQGGKSSSGPIIPADGRPLAEWSGSNTGGSECPGPCKPIAAQWSSVLNCDITVTEAQLEPLGHAHEARCVQTGLRISHDLTLVGTPPTGTACQWLKANIVIKTNEQAKQECPRLCPAGTQWKDQWITWNDKSECGCCAPSKR